MALTILFEAEWRRSGAHASNHRWEVAVDVREMIEQARDTLTVKRVFGEPYEHNGVVFIPAAAVGGGGGGGSGEGEKPDGTGVGKGQGGGYGLAAKPAGAYVITGDTVKWQPAVDVNRIIFGGQVVAVVFLLVLRALFKRRR
jgi:uncharacterized spore protein YtfJ